MKKFLCLISSLCLIACSHKADDITAKYQNVTIDYKMVEEGSMVTKSIEGSAIAEAISKCIPSQLSLTLTSKTGGGSYTINTGDSVSIPVDKYTVTGRYTPTKIYLRGTSCYYGSGPVININTELEITLDKSVYEVNATYECFVIVYDYSEVSSISSFYSGNETKISSIDGNTFGYVFIYGDFTSIPLSLRVYKASGTTYADTDFSIVTSRSASGVYVQNGKYYILHPTEETDIDGRIDITYPAWEGGSI